MGSADQPIVTQRAPELSEQTVVVIGGSAGIGLETARRARAEGAEVILTGRNADRLEVAANDVRARSTATFDANDPDELAAFFAALDGPIDHVMVTAGGPYYAPLAEMDFTEARRALQEHPMLMLGVARHAVGKVRPGGALLFMGGTGARHPSMGVGISSAMTNAAPCADRDAGPRDRSRPDQPDRGRLRRHTLVRIAARGRPRGPPTTAPGDAPDRTRRRS